MSYSSKQKLFAEFMLNKIGITNLTDIEIYLSHLEKLYGKNISYQNHKSYYGLSWYYSVSECIDILKDEIELKKNKQGIKIIDSKTLVTSTDLANYVYCPSSYSISNSFLIEKPSGEDFSRIGTQLHEQLFVASSKWYRDYEHYNDQKENDLRRIKKSRLIFAGHDSEYRVFSNDNWNGVPDYIFQDSENNYFVVEEKFHSTKTLTDLEKTDNFYLNHIIQLVSYLKNIKEYEIKYGYLLYWYYYYDDNGNLSIYKYETKKIFLDDNLENTYSTVLQKINELRTTSKVNFDNNVLNMKKCAGCIVNKYCGHKTKKFNTISFPYNKEYINLYFALFPEDLKK